MDEQYFLKRDQRYFIIPTQRDRIYVLDLNADGRWVGRAQFGNGATGVKFWTVPELEAKGAEEISRKTALNIMPVLFDHQSKYKQGD